MFPGKSSRSVRFQRVSPLPKTPAWFGRQALHPRGIRKPFDFLAPRESLKSSPILQRLLPFPIRPRRHVVAPDMPRIDRPTALSQGAGEGKAIGEAISGVGRERNGVLRGTSSRSAFSDFIPRHHPCAASFGPPAGQRRFADLQGLQHRCQGLGGIQTR